QRLVEPGGGETLACGRERADAWQDDPPRLRDARRVRGEVHARAEPLERAPHRRRVADAVVEERDGGRGARAGRLPSVGRTPPPVTAIAARSARAADLKTASAAWWPFRARRTSTWRLNFPRNAADFQNSSTSANGKSFVTRRSSLSTGDSNTMYGRPERSTT